LIHNIINTRLRIVSIVLDVINAMNIAADTIIAAVNAIAAVMMNDIRITIDVLGVVTTVCQADIMGLPIITLNTATLATTAMIVAMPYFETTIMVMIIIITAITNANMVIGLTACFFTADA